MTIIQHYLLYLRMANFDNDNLVNKQGLTGTIQFDPKCNGDIMGRRTLYNIVDGQLKVWYIPLTLLRSFLSPLLSFIDLLSRDIIYFFFIL
jgi:hypothetical protein